MMENWTTATGRSIRASRSAELSHRRAEHVTFIAHSSHIRRHSWRFVEDRSPVLSCDNGSLTFAEDRHWGIRDAEVAGSNLAFRLPPFLFPHQLDHCH